MSAENKASVLVVGSDSLIGGALFERLACDRFRVFGTTRRREAVTEARLFLDLGANADNWRPPESIEVVILCAGITKMRECSADPQATARVNVDGISKVARQLAERGAFLVYLSTNQVFDGSKPNRLANEPLSPRTEYGRQKAEVERRLLSRGNGAIVRLTKVIQPQMPLLATWLHALRKGERIRPFADMVMAPVPLALTVSVLQRMVETRLPGIIQVSGGEDVTYASVAYHIAERVGADRKLIDPISVRDAGIPPEEAPPHTTLDATRLRNEFGLEPPNVWNTIDSAIGLRAAETHVV